MTGKPWPDRWIAVEQRQRAFRQRFEHRSRTGWFAQFMDPFGGIFTLDYMTIRWAASDLAARRIAEDDGGVLYGFGAAQPKHIGPQSPRDFGLRVPLSYREPVARAQAR